MIVTLPVEKLKEILELASRFVAKHSTLPVLENVYLKASVDTIVFKATDMEKYISIELPVNVESEGALTVNAKMFLDIVKMIEEDEVKLIVDEDNDILTIKTLTDEFKLKGIPASEYVASPSIEWWKKFLLSPDVFVRGVDKVEFAVTEKNFAPVLTWILVRFKREQEGNKLIFVWTDSFRLAEYKFDYEGDLEEEKYDVIIPKMNIWDIIKVLKYAIDEEVQAVDFLISENLVWFDVQINDMKIFVSSILIQGDFPNYENESVIPSQFNTKVVVEKDILEKAIKKVLTFTKSENNFVELNITWSECIVTSWLTEIWEWKTKIPVVVEWADITFGINGKYVLDFIKAIEADKLSLNIVDSEKPIVFKDLEDANYTYVVRPLVK